jgi:hypothetical protein
MADKPEKPVDDFIIPKKFLEQLEEFANGGFILLTFSRNGNPVIHHCFETKKDQLALESALFSYANKLEGQKYDEEHGALVEDDDEEDDDEEESA